MPVHADQYDPTAPGNNQWSADYPGYVRTRLAELFGGTEVLAQGTLGRQETIGADPHYPEVVKQGHIHHQRDRSRARSCSSHNRHDA